MRTSGGLKEMNRRLFSVVALSLVALFAPRVASAQKLSVKWEELTAGEFRNRRFSESKGTLLIAFWNSGKARPTFSARH